MILQYSRNILFISTLISLLIISSCKPSSSDNEIFTSSLVENIRSHQSIHYKISVEKYSDHSLDTSITSYEIWVIRKKGHHKRNGFIWVNNNYRPYTKVFDRGTMWRTDPTKNSTSEITKFRGSFIAPCDYIDFFLNPIAFKDQITNINNDVLITDTTVNQSVLKRVLVKFQGNEEGEQSSIEYILDKRTYAPLQAIMKTQNGVNTRFLKLSFSNVVFDNLDIKIMQERHKELLKTYPINTKISSSKSSILKSMLQIKDIAPSFYGIFYANQEPFNLDDYLGKNVIVLDFWYSHCPPCIKALPEISELKNNYENKGVKVFGVNSIDNKPQSLPYLKTFVEKRSISYDLILANPDVDLMYQVQRYPTLYVIGLDGTIEFVEFGYHKETMEELSNKIEELLQPN